MAELKTALELRRNKQYDEALRIYQELYSKEPESGIAAAIINCLRGLERYDDAEAFYEQASKECALTPWLKTEHVWTLYAKYIKPVETPDKDLFIEKANQVMKLTDDLLPRKLTAFKVSDVLGREPDADWNAIRKWLESIQEVESERATVDPAKKMSDKRKWYFKYTKTLAKLGEYDLCRRYCMKAQRIFKNAYFFKHRAAKCAKAQGLYDVAQREFNALLSMHDEWYVHMDMAELSLTTQSYSEAEQQIILAIQKCKNLQLKLRTFLLWAQILHHREPSLAWLPLHFFIRYRESRDWPIPQEAQDLAAQYPIDESSEKIDLGDLETRVEALAKQRGSDYQPLRSGVIKNLREKFGFVKADDGTDIFFSLSGYRGRMPMVGQRVTFRIKRAYDRRKKRESLEAYDVTQSR